MSFAQTLPFKVWAHAQNIIHYLVYSQSSAPTNPVPDAGMPTKVHFISQTTHKGEIIPDPSSVTLAKRFPTSQNSFNHMSAKPFCMSEFLEYLKRTG